VKSCTIQSLSGKSAAWCATSDLLEQSWGWEDGGGGCGITMDALFAGGGGRAMTWETCGGGRLATCCVTVACMASAELVTVPAP